MMYNTERNIKIFWGVFAVFLMIYIYFTSKHNNEWQRKVYEEFNKTNIKDTIIKVGYYARGDEIIFNNQKVLFYSEASYELNNYTFFYSTAEVGDSIIKLPYSDTLILIKKNGEILRYTFQKPSEAK